jgi:type I restriction enzyme S subunit
LAVNAPGRQRPYLRTKNVFDGRIDIDDVLTMPMTDEQFAQFRIRNGDVLLNEGQSIELVGRCAMYQDEYPQPCAIQNALLRFRADAGVSEKFASYLFRHCQHTGVFARIALQTTSVAHLGGSRFERLRLAWPTEPEQRVIAEALSDVDGLLGGLDRIIAKKRDLKQAVMQQLLTSQTRLPGFHGEWEVKRLGKIATCFSGGTPPTEVAAYYGGDIPWITSGDLNKGYITDVEGRISQAGLANSAAQMVEANTLLIALYGATSGVTAISKIRAAINQAVLAIIPLYDSMPFLYFKLRSLREWLISTYTQGGQPNLSGDIVKSVELPLPALPEQTAIAELLRDMDAELAALEQRREKTRALKRAMMEELLTGRTRLA